MIDTTQSLSVRCGFPLKTCGNDSYLFTDAINPRMSYTNVLVGHPLLTMDSRLMHAEMTEGLNQGSGNTARSC